MTEYVVVRDSRLEGQMPNVFTAWWNDLNIISTSATTPLQSVFDQVNALKEEHGKMHTMFILCHGYAGGNRNLAMSGDFGGRGLQLGAEDVLHSNVSAWEEIKDTVSNVVIYACAAANTESGSEFTTEDGEYLMGALAIHTNAVVYAADRIQWYQPDDFDFGKWEGQLLAFEPSGVAPVNVSEVPVGFNEFT